MTVSEWVILRFLQNQTYVKKKKSYPLIWRVSDVTVTQQCIRAFTLRRCPWRRLCSRFFTFLKLSSPKASTFSNLSFTFRHTAETSGRYTSNVHLVGETVRCLWSCVWKHKWFSCDSIFALLHMNSANTHQRVCVQTGGGWVTASSCLCYSRNKSTLLKFSSGTNYHQIPVGKSACGRPGLTLQAPSCAARQM